MDKLLINVKDFSITPGTRHAEESDFSGEEFRKKTLKPIFQQAVKNNTTLTINLDQTIGYGTSWLEEAFGGLARELGKEEVLRTLEFISEEEPYLVDDIISYINSAN